MQELKSPSPNALGLTFQPHWIPWSWNHHYPQKQYWLPLIQTGHAKMESPAREQQSHWKRVRPQDDPPKKLEKECIRELL